MGKPHQRQKHSHPLPKIQEQYFAWYGQNHHVCYATVYNIKIVLRTFDQWLTINNLRLFNITIEQVDAFLGNFLTGYSESTCKTYRSYLRGFLGYLYHQRGILTRDIAPLVKGKPQFGRSKPPRFLRSHELKQLFDSLGQELSSAKQLRIHAIVHLAYCLGLRPIEISLMSLDDISFSKQQLKVPVRKNTTPLSLPVPEETLKAIVAYIVGGRPKTSSRRLFLTLVSPYRPLKAHWLTCCISQCMRKLGLPSTAYWLRHSYAQNLLEAGMSIYEIKEMLGHDHIESTRKYLSIHIKLMREVLLDEPV